MADEKDDRGALETALEGALEGLPDDSESRKIIRRVVDGSRVTEQWTRGQLTVGARAIIDALKKDVDNGS